MKVNLTLQCLATLLFPTGLYAFKRINKLRRGLLVYLIINIFTIFLFASAIGYWKTNNITGNDLGFQGIIITLILTTFSIITPIIFMRKWSIEWNQKNKGEARITS